MKPGDGSAPGYKAAPSYKVAVRIGSLIAICWLDRRLHVGIQVEQVVRIEFVLERDEPVVIAAERRFHFRLVAFDHVIAIETDRVGLDGFIGRS